mmetsp:Transcript_30357/g.98034  ORF Transcript_30357/g.98034 Transcript_30357/m.98034 type:complete len:207 (+) Transcript_30357:276-896(+)
MSSYSYHTRYQSHTIARPGTGTWQSRTRLSVRVHSLVNKSTKSPPWPLVHRAYSQRPVRPRELRPYGPLPLPPFSLRPPACLASRSRLSRTRSTLGGSLDGPTGPQDQMQEAIKGPGRRGRNARERRSEKTRQAQEAEEGLEQTETRGVHRDPAQHARRAVVARWRRHVCRSTAKRPAPMTLAFVGGTPTLETHRRRAFASILHIR